MESMTRPGERHCATCTCPAVVIDLTVYEHREPGGYELARRERVLA